MRNAKSTTNSHRLSATLLLAACWTGWLTAAGISPQPAVAATAKRSANDYTEPYRPQFHFTPESNWMNDPNGMVHYDGEYHLFYQHNPFGDKWGHMSWGHAISPDLVHWEHLPVALLEEDGVMIFSGSAVVDWNNTSGLGTGSAPPLVAIYTGHYTTKPLQNQHIAYSNDRGRTWTKYAGNPVLDIGAKDFRDPKVFWHEPTQQWVMVVALPTERKVSLYKSSDLKEWVHLSNFGPAGAVQGIWECPDLFPLPIEGSAESKWVLIVNIGGGSVAGGSGCQYFTGHFDGQTFANEELPIDSAQSQAKGQVYMDFEENHYGKWTASGDAFGTAPSRGTLDAQQPVSGFQGRGFVNTYLHRDASTGTLTSPGFPIESPYINFLIGGGRHPEETGIALMVEGAPVRRATGRDEERLDWHSWDVRDYQGKTGQLRIYDHHTGGWGHINVDHIIFSDAPAKPLGQQAHWVDFGKDFYAAVSWSDVPANDGRRLWLGWMSNWQYANEVPTSPWRSAMSIPRSLKLRPINGELRLIQSPIDELKALRARHERTRLRAANGEVDLTGFAELAQGEFELEMDLELNPDAVFELHLRTRENEAVTLRIDLPNELLSFDRRNSGHVDFSHHFPADLTASVRLIEGRLNLQLFVDASSVEIFANHGETVISSLVFPIGKSRELALDVREGEILEGELRIWELRSAWRGSPARR